MKPGLHQVEPVPARKPLSEHKLPMSVSMEPDNREWIREHWRELGYRSESHLVDDAIRVLRATRENSRKERRI